MSNELFSRTTDSRGKVGITLSVAAAAISDKSVTDSSDRNMV